MTGALEEFLKRQRVPEFWELGKHPTTQQLKLYNDDFKRKHPEISDLLDKQMNKLPHIGENI